MLLDQEITANSGCKIQPKVLFKGRGSVAKKLQSFDHEGMVSSSTLATGRTILPVKTPGLRQAIFVVVAGSLSLVLCGCSSKTTRLSTEPEGAYRAGRAHPAAYGIVDTFTFGKPQEIRPANEFMFYFKECETTDPENDRAFFSKTAYSCSGAR